MEQDEKKMRRKMGAKKTFTIVQLLGWLNVSVPTARRRIAKWQVHSSYNQNGRYYTFPDMPSFDEHGLWRCCGARFSAHGNLVETVVHLANTSKAGCSANELEAMLGIPARSFLAPFRHRSDLYREKVGGRFIWLAADAKTRRQQMAERHVLDCVGLKRLPSDRKAVEILAELIRSPEYSAADVVRALSSRQIKVSAEEVESLLLHHDLLKKTPSRDSGSSEST